MDVKLVRDMMQIGVVTCPDHTRLPEAVKILLRDNLEALVVLDKNGHAAGLFGRTEAAGQYGLMGINRQAWQTRTVAQEMSRDIPELPPDIPAPAAAQMMLDWGVRVAYLMHHDSGIRWPAAELRIDDLLLDMVSERVE